MNDHFFFCFDIIIPPVFWQPTFVGIIGMLHCCNELVKIIINNFVNNFVNVEFVPHKSCLCTQTLPLSFLTRASQNKYPHESR